MLADESAIAVAAHDIRTLLRTMPGALLWTPGKAVWGVALVRGTANAIVSIDGCLRYAVLTWPGHYLPGQEYPLDGVVRVLARTMRIGRIDGQVMVSTALPGSVTGWCCVVVSSEELPWLSSEQAVLPVVGTPVWNVPDGPEDSAHLLPIHPWVTSAGAAPASESLAEFLSMVGEPVEMVILPTRMRSERLVSYWRLNIAHERARLTMCNKNLPEWMNEGMVAEIERLAVAWVTGWRGPREPTEALIAPLATDRIVSDGVPIENAAVDQQVDSDGRGGGDPWNSASGI